MPKITFIRHAEKDGEDFTASITEEGRNRAKWFEKPSASVVLTSCMPRSIETAEILYPNQERHQVSMLNEYEKHRETEEEFIERVRQSLEFIKSHDDCVVISHGRFMCVAYQLLVKKIVIGFDYLGSFRYEHKD